MKIRILGKNVSINIVPADTLPGRYGEYVDVVESISLSSELTGENRRRVLMHEIVHAVLRISGLNYMFSDKQEEAICTAMENIAESVHSGELKKVMGELGK